MSSDVSLVEKSMKGIKVQAAVISIPGTWVRRGRLSSFFFFALFSQELTLHAV